MARADARTLGLLNRWAVFMHEDPWRFNQILGQGVRIIPNCQNQPYIQYERQYIADALVESIVKAAEYLGYWPSPHWITDEIIPINSDLHWSAQTLATRFGYITAFGKRAVSQIAANVTISYTDSNNDNIDDLATLTVTGVTNIAADEIQVFFRQEDGAEADADEYWQIEPLKVVKSGDTATITGPRWLFVHPVNVWANEYQSGSAEKYYGETTDDTCFVTEVDVYRVYANPTDAAQLLMNSSIVGSENAVESVTGQTVNDLMGHFTAYTSAAQSSPLGVPFSLRVSYRAGYPLEANGQMDKQFAQAIVRYANTLMPQQPQMCDRTVGMWSDDRAVSPDIAARDTWTPPPFGISNAGLYAWSVISSRRITLKARATKREG